MAAGSTLKFSGRMAASSKQESYFCVTSSGELRRKSNDAVMKYVIVIPGAPNGFGELTAHALEGVCPCDIAVTRERLDQP